MPIFDFNNERENRRIPKNTGLSSDELDVITTVFDYFRLYCPDVDVTEFNGHNRTDLLFQKDRKKFEQFFSALVKKLDVLSVISLDEIPENKEFERFPTFMDIVDFFYEKYQKKR